MRGHDPVNRETAAEREGFEPSVQVNPIRRLSKPVPSATRPSLPMGGLGDPLGDPPNAGDAGDAGDTGGGDKPAGQTRLRCASDPGPLLTLFGYQANQRRRRDSNPRSLRSAV